MTDHDPFVAVPNGARHEALADLAGSGPLHHLTLPTTRPAWVITGYAEARAALADPRLVKGGPDTQPFVDQLEPEISAGLNNHMLTADPPKHTRLRKLVAMAFTRRQVERLAPGIEAICATLLDGLGQELDAAGEADLLASFAHPLPLTVICELLGIPDDTRADVRRWIPPLLAGGINGVEEYAAAARRMITLLRDLMAHKRDVPGDDLLSALIEARDGADRLSEDELTSMVLLLFAAGHDTTVALISNSAVALMEHPDQWKAVRAEPQRWPAAVEELLRFDSAVQVPMPLYAAEPVEIAGQRIPAGSVVLPSLLAANRDPAKFADPATLDLTRTESGHLAFGHGIHHCLGAPLARLESRIALRALGDRFPDLRLGVPAADLRREPALLANKLEALPVRLTAGNGQPDQLRA